MSRSSQFEYGSVEHSADAKHLNRILSQCFNSLLTDEPTYLKRVGFENIRVLRHQNQIIGGLAIVPLGQWYNAACVPMAGIAAVGIAPDYRGQGAALTLLQHMLQELHDRGTPISVLYSAAQPLYRKVGYEQSGAVCTWQVPTATIQVKNYALPIQPIEPTVASFDRLYQQQAQRTNGYLDRNSFIWKELLDPPGSIPPYAYQIGSSDAPEGYLIFKQQQNLISVRDWVLLTPEALQRFWTFLADHGSQVESVQWRSSIVDPLGFVLPEQTAKVDSYSCWMLRIVNVREALEKRNYLPAVGGELHFDIHDDLLPGNNGKFSLTVTDGKGTVTQGGRGEIRLNVRALSSLYTGLFTAHQLQLAGSLEGSATALEAVTRIFSAASPWMQDFF
jgi:predicted acetyltransferase